ncbi:MAG: co-chaperone GroES [Candidatus Marinimicrobia bacterium]|nr:co-chaperone GroES [Candidatus Neomarinimicrobiota bacterium]
MVKQKKKITAALKLKPMAGYVLIEPVELEKRTATGIVLPDTHDEKSQRGKVIAKGAPIYQEGQEITGGFEVGDTVIYKKWGGDEVKLGLSGQELIFVKFEDILAIVE